MWTFYFYTSNNVVIVLIIQINSHMRGVYDVFGRYTYGFVYFYYYSVTYICMWILYSIIVYAHYIHSTHLHTCTYTYIHI